MAKVSDIYGSMVFNEHTMQERLPSATYKSLLRTIKEGEPLDIEVANVVAHAMKAVSYTHLNDAGSRCQGRRGRFSPAFDLAPLEMLADMFGPSDRKGVRGNAKERK